MAVALNNMKVNMKNTTTRVTVPNNSRARLMYYLDCMCTALEISSSDARELQNLRDYDNYAALSDDEETQLLLLCAMLSPDVLLNKVIFQDDAMCGDLSNSFYEITAVQNRMVVSSHIVIGGQTKRVKSIMTFKMVWLRTYYLEPMEALAGELEARQAAARRQSARRDDGCCVM